MAKKNQSITHNKDIEFTTQKESFLYLTAITWKDGKTTLHDSRIEDWKDFVDCNTIGVSDIKVSVDNLKHLMKGK